MDLETVIQSEVSQKEVNKYRILMHICGIQKNGIDELIYKAEIRDTDVENKCTDTKGGRGGGMDWEIGINIYTLLYTEQITNKNLLNSTGNSIQYSAMTYMGIESKKEWIYVYV